MLVLPKRIPPAFFRLAITVASSLGTKFLRIVDPQVVKTPLAHHWSFAPSGIP